MALGERPLTAAVHAEREGPAGLLEVARAGADDRALRGSARARRDHEQRAGDGTECTPTPHRDRYTQRG